MQSSKISILGYSDHSPNFKMSSHGYSEKMLKNWLREHIPQAQAMKGQPAFYRNIERTLDAQREGHNLMTAKPRWPKDIIDLTSSDFLSLNRDGRVRDAFMKELSSHPDYQLSAAGSRVQYGIYDYLIQVEKEIAEFHGAETAYIGHSGFFCNIGIVASVPYVSPVSQIQWVSPRPEPGRIRHSVG